MTIVRTKTPVRENVWLRMMLLAPTGGGKTLGALEIASKLFDGALPVYGLDTEHGRMRLYLDRYKLAELFELEGNYAPEEYIKVIDIVEQEAPGAILLIDSISHEWMGAGGILPMADRFGDWKVVRPKHNAFIDRMMGAQLHIIVCCRAKMKWEVGEEERAGGGKPKQTITKLGLGPVQSDDIIYEFDILGSIDVATHDCTFSNRCEPLVDKTFSLWPGDFVASTITEWLSEGEAPTPPEAAPKEAISELVTMLLDEGHTAERIEARFQEVRKLNRGVLPPAYIAEATEKAAARLAAKTAAEQPAESPLQAALEAAQAEHAELVAEVEAAEDREKTHDAADHQ